MIWLPEEVCGTTHLSSGGEDPLEAGLAVQITLDHSHLAQSIRHVRLALQTTEAGLVVHDLVVLDQVHRVDALLTDATFRGTAESRCHLANNKERRKGEGQNKISESAPRMGE